MTFAALLAAFFLTRLLPLLTGIERVFHYDEFDIGVIAREWLKGPAFPFWHYQMDPYGGESIVLSGLAAPLAKVFGASLFVFKMPSLLFAVLTFAWIYFFVKRWFGPEKAAAAGLLLVFCPPSFIQFSLSPLSGHTEALLFAAGTFYFFYDFLYGEKKTRSLFLAGVCSGFGFWFFHSTLAVTVSCLLAWAVLERPRSILKFLFVFAAGSAAGLLPWFAYNLQQGAHEHSFVSDSLRPLLELPRYWKMLAKKAFWLSAAGLPFSFGFFPVFGLHERIYSTLYFAAAWLPAIPFWLKKTWRSLKLRKDPDKLLPLIFFPLVFLAIAFGSSFNLAYTIGWIGWRYLSTLQLFALPLPALLIPSGHLRKAVLAAAVVLGLAGQTSLWFREPAGRAFEWKGLSYYQIATSWRFFLASKIPDLQTLTEKTGRWDKFSRYNFFWGLTDASLSAEEPVLLAGSNIHANQTLAALPASEMPYLYEFMGSTFQDLRELSAASSVLQGRARNLLHKGFFEHWDGFSVTDFSQCPGCYDFLGAGSEWAYAAFGEYLFQDLLAGRPLGFTPSRGQIDAMKNKITLLKLSPDKEIWVYRGIALADFRTAWDSNILLDRSFKKIIAAASPAQRQALYWGLGWVARAMFREDRKRAAAMASSLPEEGRAEAMKGFSAFEDFYGIPPHE